MCLGIPGQIVALSDDREDVAIVLVSGAERAINVSMVAEDGVAPGDWVLVHAGFALDTLDEREAHETLAVLKELSDSYAAELASAAGDAAAG